MKKGLALLLAVLMLFSLAACKKEEPAAEAPASTESVVIGGLAPLTGAVAVYGITSTNAAKLAFDEINAAGGILGGRMIEFNLLDEKGDDAEAINAYNKLSSEGVVAILGDVTSKPTIAVAEIAASERMPMITATATHPDVTTFGDNIFRVCFLDPFQGKTMARFAKNELGATKVAAIYNTSDDYSDGVAKAFVEEAEALGMEVVAYEGHGNEDVDFKTQLTNIANAAPDAVMVSDYYSQAALIAAQAKEVGLDAVLLGADGWDGVTTTVDEGSYDVIENSYFCNHFTTENDSEKVQNFIAAYKAAYNEEPTSFAALGYDAAYVLANAINAAGSTDPEAIIEALKATEYEGVTGSLTFDENGNPIKTVAIIKIAGGKNTFYSMVEPE